MATFKIKTENGTFKVTAPDEATALEAVENMGNEKQGYNKGNYLTNTIDSITSGLTGGLGAKITAAEAALLGKTPEGDWFNYDESMGQRYDNALAAERKQNANFKETNPVTAYGSEIGAAILPFSKAAQLGGVALKSLPGAAKLAGVATQAAPRLAPLTGRLAGTAAIGSGFGVTQAIGDDTNIKDGAILGGVSGLAGQGVGEVVGKVGGKIAGKFMAPKIKTAKDLKAAASVKFEAAKDIAKTENIIYGKSAFPQLQKDILNYATKLGFRPKNEPGANQVIKSLKDVVKKNHTLEGLLALRKEFSNGYRFGIRDNPNNNEIVHKAIEKLDELIANKSNILPGSNRLDEVAKLVKEGRTLSHSGFKQAKVEDVAEFARRDAVNLGSGGNIANKTLQGMEKIVRKGARGYTPAEREALEKAAQPSLLQRGLKTFGQMGPLGNGLGGMIHGGAAVASSGATVPLSIATGASKLAFNAIVKGNAKELMQVIANGGVKLPKSTIQQLLESPEVSGAIGKALAAGTLVAID